MKTNLPVVNLADTKFECTFGRGCDGLCCQNGRPSLDAEEQGRIRDNLAKFLPHLRPEARALVEGAGFLSNRRKSGEPMMRVVDGWCVFFNGGCVLHKVGAAEGRKYHYKPMHCVVFPLGVTPGGALYVRQWGYKDEAWDVFCLDPARSAVPAAESLAEEIAYVADHATRLQARAGRGQPDA